MRVVTGTARGRRLVAPKRATRPTSDRVKEALFSSLHPMLAGATVLDLYAGSGALGIEALSRGATHATFVEVARSARTAITTNLAATDLADRATVVGRDVLAALRDLARDGAVFDLVLADPPYDLGADDVGEAMAAVVDVTATGALVRLEQASRSADAIAWPEGLVAGRVRAYGHTTILEAQRR